MSDQNFYIFVADITGGGVTGLTNGDFNNTVLLDGVPVSGAAVTIAPTTDPGLYTINVDPIGVGTNLIKADPINPLYIVSPDFNDYFKESTYTIDNVYGSVISQQVSPVPYDFTTRFQEVTVKHKENDHYDDVLSVPHRYVPLTGWTDWTVEVYPEAALDSGMVPNISGATATVTVLDPDTGTLDINISSDHFANQIAEGKNEAIVYADIQGHNANGKRKTVITITFNLVREFNKLV